MRSARIGAWARIVRRAGPFRVCVVSGVVVLPTAALVAHAASEGGAAVVPESYFRLRKRSERTEGSCRPGFRPFPDISPCGLRCSRYGGVQCRTKPLSAPKAGPEGRIAWISGCLTRSFDPPGIGCSEWLSNRNTNEKRVSACGRTPSFSNKARADYSVSTTSTSVNTQSKRSLALCASSWRICD